MPRWVESTPSLVTLLHRIRQKNLRAVLMLCACQFRTMVDTQGDVRIRGAAPGAPIWVNFRPRALCTVVLESSCSRFRVNIEAFSTIYIRQRKILVVPLGSCVMGPSVASVISRMNDDNPGIY